MKRGRLPLTALRSFEAAGRHMSFSRAAEELYVSQAAISRQIRELEELLGKPLFRRLHRSVQLTDTGEVLLARLTPSFDDIERQISAIIAKSAPSVLKVNVEPSFAGEFLIQRIDVFQRQHPDIEISIDSELRLIEFHAQEADLAVRYGLRAKSWPRTESRHLADVLMTPVMTRELLASGPPLNTPADLRHYTLLHDYNRDAWAYWFKELGYPELATQRGPQFADAALAMQGAKLGHGVALGDRVLNGDDIRAGRLVSPFARHLDVPYGAYWLVAPDFKRLSRPALAFAEWLRAEIVKNV